MSKRKSKSIKKAESIPPRKIFEYQLCGGNSIFLTKSIHFDETLPGAAALLQAEAIEQLVRLYGKEISVLYDWTVFNNFSLSKDDPLKFTSFIVCDKFFQERAAKESAQAEKSLEIGEMTFRKGSALHTAPSVVKQSSIEAILQQLQSDMEKQKHINQQHQVDKVEQASIIQQLKLDMGKQIVQLQMATGQQKEEIVQLQMDMGQQKVDMGKQIVQLQIDMRQQKEDMGKQIVQLQTDVGQQKGIIHRLEGKLVHLQSEIEAQAVVIGGLIEELQIPMHKIHLRVLIHHLREHICTTLSRAPKADESWGAFLSKMSSEDLVRCGLNQRAMQYVLNVVHDLNDAAHTASKKQIREAVDSVSLENPSREILELIFSLCGSYLDE